MLEDLRPSGDVTTKLIRNNKKIKISFDKIISNPKSKLNFYLLGGDQIIIETKPNMVEITGEVNSPGTYQYIKGYDFKDYVRFAGGMNRNASRYSSYILYPNGKSKQMKLFSFDRDIPDGSTIVLGRKVDVQPFNLTEYATNWTAIYSELLQAYMIVTLAARN